MLEVLLDLLLKLKCSYANVSTKYVSEETYPIFSGLLKVKHN